MERAFGLGLLPLVALFNQFVMPDMVVVVCTERRWVVGRRPYDLVVDIWPRREVTAHLDPREMIPIMSYRSAESQLRLLADKVAAARLCLLPHRSVLPHTHQTTPDILLANEVIMRVTSVPNCSVLQHLPQYRIFWSEVARRENFGDAEQCLSLWCKILSRHTDGSNIINFTVCHQV